MQILIPDVLALRPGCYLSEDIFKCIFIGESFPFRSKYQWSLFLDVQLSITQWLSIASGEGLAPIITYNSQTRKFHIVYTLKQIWRYASIMDPLQVSNLYNVLVLLHNPHHLFTHGRKTVVSTFSLMNWIKIAFDTLCTVQNINIESCWILVLSGVRMNCSQHYHRCLACSKTHAYLQNTDQ